jgi:hypothetical protein
MVIRHCHNIRLHFACTKFQTHMVHRINSSLCHKKSILVSEVTCSPSKLKHHLSALAMASSIKPDEGIAQPQMAPSTKPDEKIRQTQTLTSKRTLRVDRIYSR